MTCDWPVDTTCLPDLPAEEDPGYAAAAAAREGAVNLATMVLWGLSGRQFGICSYIVRPCVQVMDPPSTGSRLTSYVLSWEGEYWLDLPCGCSGNLCRESGAAKVHLPGPAQGVVEVIVNGAALPAEQYRLEGDVLYRVGANWPVQDLGRPMGSPGTWSVEYLRGQPVPAGVDRLTGLLAKEFMSACSGAACRLPRTVTQVSRQGITYTIYNPNQIYESGKTGLPEVDLWLSSINPYRLQAAPSVL